MPQANTIEIPEEQLHKAVNDGTIRQEDLDALEIAKQKAKDDIERLRVSYRKQIISHEQLEKGIRGIRKEMQDKILALNFNDV